MKPKVKRAESFTIVACPTCPGLAFVLRDNTGRVFADAHATFNNGADFEEFITHLRQEYRRATGGDADRNSLDEPDVSGPTKGNIVPAMPGTKLLTFCRKEEAPYYHKCEHDVIAWEVAKTYSSNTSDRWVQAIFAGDLNEDGVENRAWVFPDGRIKFEVLRGRFNGTTLEEFTAFVAEQYQNAFQRTTEMARDSDRNSSHQPPPPALKVLH